MSVEREKEVIDGMNKTYLSYLEEPNSSISSAYSKMVQKNPYRVLALHSYDIEEKPLQDVSIIICIF